MEEALNLSSDRLLDDGDHMKVAGHHVLFIKRCMVTQLLFGLQQTFFHQTGLQIMFRFLYNCSLLRRNCNLRDEDVLKNTMILLKDKVKERVGKFSQSSSKENGCLRGIITKWSLLLGCNETTTSAQKQAR